MKRNRLVIVRGLPGSGKSSFAKKNFNCLILENDMFHIGMGKYQYSNGNIKDAISWCYNTCMEALYNGMDVVVANTFTKKRFVEGYRELALNAGAEFEVYRCVADYGNTHNVPKFVLENMRNSFEDWPGEKIVGENNENTSKNAEFD